MRGARVFDMISRGAMMEGLRRVSGAALPFTRMFYGRSSEYLWEMDDGQVHRIPQGEGGEQGDPMMPLLCSLGQHGALEAAHSQFTRGERLLAFFDDTFIVTPQCSSCRTCVWIRSRRIEEPLRDSCSRGQNEDLEPSRQPSSHL